MVLMVPIPRAMVTSAHCNPPQRFPWVRTRAVHTAREAIMGQPAAVARGHLHHLRRFLEHLHPIPVSWSRQILLTPLPRCNLKCKVPFLARRQHLATHPALMSLQHCHHNLKLPRRPTARQDSHRLASFQWFVNLCLARNENPKPQPKDQQQHRHGWNLFRFPRSSSRCHAGIPVC